GLALAGCSKDTPAPTPVPPVATAPAPAPVPAPAPTPPAPAVTVTTVDLGNAVGDDKRVTTPATTFAKTDTIHASVATTAVDAAAPSTGKLTARWTYQDGQLVDELSQDYSFTGTGTTTFQVSNPDGWPLGKYKLEILLDGTLVQTREFEVK
ncbi:MAG TPA: hypothetical protein VLK29_05575, partial [Luteimonas sp.]|nr:hypothetical protein [Luteimonas sp.]